ncbi:RNA polymerase sigma factor [Marinoscillum sp.]|uniref:RNA polymerase sigma factor n=1 Tax=Marinoscillum sp. TaxID=2024838 RepID=UPI003BAD1A56
MSTDLETWSDAELIDKLKEGNTSRLFQELYERYYKKVLDKCYSFVKNREMARELAEDVFSKTFEKIGSFKQKSSFSSWLYSITYNHCIDYLREKKKLHYPDWNKENEIPEIIDESDEALSEITYENLLLILEEIHPEEKALLLMKYQHDLSIKEISTSLRISENAAKMRLKRARTRVVFLYSQKYLKHR